MAQDRIGRLEVVCGPMFAGKTEELLRRVRRALIAGRRVTVITHALDTRHGADRLASHIGRDFPSLAAATPEAVEAAIPGDAEVIAIDEAQFFGPGLVPVTGRLAARGLVVLVAGLDVTFDGRPFEPLPVADGARRAGRQADGDLHDLWRGGGVPRQGRRDAGGPGDLTAANVGGTETYQARCRRHVPWAGAG